MPRGQRVHFDGAVYHVHNRLARGVGVFEEDARAGEFAQLLQEVVERDGVTVFAWVLLPNHYHLAMRTGVVPLGRTIKTLQWRTAGSVNLSARVYGPLWQGRYRAKLVRDQRYLDRLVAYILNSVVGGLVDDPARYRWSGHRAVLGLRKKPIVDVDEVLRLFGESRRAARGAYTRMLRGAREEAGTGEDHGRLPWWRLGRPPREDLEDPEVSGRSRRKEAAARAQRERQVIGAEEFVERVAGAIGVGMEELQGRGRGERLSKAREVVAVLGVERWGIRVKDMARVLGKRPVTVTGWVMWGVRRRVEDQQMVGTLDRLDAMLPGGDDAEHQFHVPYSSFCNANSRGGGNNG